MKFSIRDLLLVTLCVALALGWGMDRSRLAAERIRLRRLHGETWLLQYDATAAFYGGGDTSVIQISNSSALVPNPPKK